MKIEDHIWYWLESAEHDWDTAENLFLAGKYDWCLFIGHLVLEKTLKAVFVQDNDNKFPPKTHNLLKLAENTKLELTEEQKIFLVPYSPKTDKKKRKWEMYLKSLNSLYNQGTYPGLLRLNGVR